jgi:hypothetical protein
MRQTATAEVLLDDGGLGPPAVWLRTDAVAIEFADAESQGTEHHRPWYGNLEKCHKITDFTGFWIDFHGRWIYLVV